MKTIVYLLLTMFLMASVVSAQNYSLDWYVIASGGGHAESGNYQIDATIGQPITGQASSTNYILQSGFWEGGDIPQSGYEYLPGDANMYNGAWPPMAIGGDVTYMVNYFRGVETSLPCMLGGFWASADANGDCSIIGSDVTRMVNYFRGIGTIDYCSDYLPLYPPIPPSEPAGWPNCGSSGLVLEKIIAHEEPDIGR